MEYCDEFVCLSVPGSDHIFETTGPIFTKFFVHLTCGRGSVILWRHSNTSCTSGVIDDVKFAHKPRLLDVATQLMMMMMDELTLTWHIVLRLQGHVTVKKESRIVDALVDCTSRDSCMSESICTVYTQPWAWL